MKTALIPYSMLPSYLQPIPILFLLIFFMITYFLFPAYLFFSHYCTYFVYNLLCIPFYLSRRFRFSLGSVYRYKGNQAPALPRMVRNLNQAKLGLYVRKSRSRPIYLNKIYLDDLYLLPQASLHEKMSNLANYTLGNAIYSTFFM